MKSPLFVILQILSFALIVAAFMGCSESPLEAAESSIVEDGTSKMRQSHLFANKFLSRGKVLERYEELMASNDFVLGMYKVLERYRVLERYEGYDGVTVKKNYEKSIDGFAVRVDGTGMTVEEFLAIVEADPDIEWIEPDIKLKPNLGKGSAESGTSAQLLPANLKSIGADLSWTLSGDEQGSVDGVEVYVLDTGIAHDELNIVETVNFADDEMVESSVWEHGTHIAGTIAAIDDGDGLVGVAPGARIHSLRVLNNNGEAELSAAIAAVEYVTDQKEANPSTPMVVNISLGADIGTWEYNALDNAIKASIAKGITYVIAAGNDGIDAGTVTPAHVMEAITVASYNANELSSWSNYGTWIDVLAPGEAVRSLHFGTLGFSSMDGTSVAAPHVTGAAALYLSKNPGASPTEVVNAIYFATKNDVKKAPPGTTKWRLALDLEPFGWEYFNNAGGNDTGSGGGGKGGGKNK